MAITNSSNYITSNYAFVIDFKTHIIIDIIDFNAEGVYLINNKTKTKLNKNQFFFNPHLSNKQVSFFIANNPRKMIEPIKYMGGTIYPVAALKVKPQPEDLTPAIPDIAYDSLSDSKFLLYAYYYDSTAPSARREVWVVGSGIRTVASVENPERENAITHRVDLTTGAGFVYINYGITLDQYRKINNPEIPENFQIDIPFIDTTPKDSSSVQTDTLVSGETTIINKFGTRILGIREIDIPKNPAKMEKKNNPENTPFSGKSYTFVTAWNASKAMVDKMYPPKSFSKSFLDYVRKMVKPESGSSNFDLSLNSPKFKTVEEMKQLMVRYKIAEGDSFTVSPTGDGLYIMDNGVVLKSKASNIELDPGGDVKITRLNSKATSDERNSVLGFSATSVATTDLLPASNAFISAPRRIPNIAKIEKTLAIIVLIADIGIKTGIYTSKMMSLVKKYETLKQKFDDDQESINR